MVSLRSLLYSYFALCLGAGSACARGTGIRRRSSTNPVSQLEPIPLSVAPGSEVYASTSPHIQYEGKWSTVSEGYLSSSSRSTRERGDSFSLSFSGSGIDWLGSCDRFHGYAQVYLDGQEAEKVNMFCDSQTPRKPHRHFHRSDLPDGQHTIKVVNLGISSVQPQRFATTIMDIDALVVAPRRIQDAENDLPQKSIFQPSKNVTRQRRGSGSRSGANPEVQKWELSQHGSTGVAAMQLAIVSSTHAIIIDKVEHNIVSISGHPAWATLYDLNTDAVRPLDLQSNSFCAGGAFLSNGTLVNVGGAQVDKTGFGDVNGLQGIRLFHPCDSGDADGCHIYENPSRMRMGSPRWYPTSLRIEDGSVLIIGGSKRGDYINSADMNNPTIEYWPPKAIHGSNGLPIPMKFLEDTLNSNLFPIAFLLPDGRVFIAANNDAMIYDWKKNAEQRLPSLPNGVRVTYPMTATGILLPLSFEDDYTPEVLICGGSTLSDRKPPEQLSSQDSASDQCVRMVLTDNGIARGWQVERMPEPRVMPDAVILPTGEVVIVNGAQSGVAGYGNVRDRVGQSNADNPALTPVIYNPLAPHGKRFYREEGMPSSPIPRIYHSVSTLTPRGDLMIAGSNPNFDRSEVKYGTEYRVEWLSPPYMREDRPSIQECPRIVNFKEEFAVRLKDATTDGQEVKVAFMDFGFVTHSVHMNSRHVWAEAKAEEDGTLSVTAPPNEQVYPPGPAWLFVLVDGVPSEGFKIMVGDGRDPPVDHAAIQNVLSKT